MAPVSGDRLVEGVSGPVERIVLERSFHVATLDYDKEEIEKRTVAFVTDLSPPGGGMTGATEPGHHESGSPGQLSRDDVIHVANLARLTLSEEEVDLFTAQLRTVLDHAADVAALDLSHLAPMAHPLPGRERAAPRRAAPEPGPGRGAGGRPVGGGPPLPGAAHRR